MTKSRNRAEDDKLGGTSARRWPLLLGSVARAFVGAAALGSISPLPAEYIEIEVREEGESRVEITMGFSELPKI